MASLALVASTLLAGCQIGFGDGENAVPAVWDLRTSHRIEDVGWPEDIHSDSFQVDPEPGELTILLPEGVTIEGPFDVVVNRPPGDTTGDLLESLAVNFDREPVAQAAQGARELAQRGASTPLAWTSGLLAMPSGETTPDPRSTPLLVASVPRGLPSTSRHAH